MLELFLQIVEFSIIHILCDTTAVVYTKQLNYFSLVK